MVKRNLIVFAGVLALGILNNFFPTVSIPNSDNIIDYQLSLFTISSVFAGFSFTELGILLSLMSEELIRRLKGTNIITKKSENIVNSIIYFCISGIFSLMFVIGFNSVIFKYLYKFNEKISQQSVDGVLFTCGVCYILFGIIYFIISSKGVYELIKKIYGYNTSKAKKMKEDFLGNIEDAKKRRNNTYVDKD